MPIVANQKPMPVSRVSQRKTQIVGHRGAAGLAPENTLAAFQVAIDLNVDGIEFDVQRSVDDHLVVIHDGAVNRTSNGMGVVQNMTLAQLQALDAGSWFDPRFRGEKIPSLDDLFDLMGGNDLLLYLEIKDPFRYEGMEAQIADKIRAYDFVDRVQVRSFYHDSLHVFHEIAPEVAISELWYEAVPTLDETHYLTLDLLYSLYTPEIIDELHGRGQKLTAWTVNEVELGQQLMAWGLDGLTTDFPDRFVHIA